MPPHPLTNSEIKKNIIKINPGLKSFFQEIIFPK